MTGLRQSDATLQSISSKLKGLNSGDESLFARLDELETKEEVHKELENLESDRLDDFPGSDFKLQQDEKRKINEKDCHIQLAETEPVRGVYCSSGSDEDGGEANATDNQKLIQVTFTKQGNKKVNHLICQELELELT